MSIKQNKTLKVIAKVIIGLLIFLTLSATAYYFVWMYPRYDVPILTYHYFGHYSRPQKGADLSELFVTSENFEKQMRFLKDKHYHVISLDELAKGMKQSKKFPHNTVVITIDDGHKSIFTYAYPTLKKYGFPAMVFLVSDYIGVKEDFLNWDEVREMSKNNISFGGHSRHHVVLCSTISKDVLWDEIAGCKEIIEKNIGSSISYFAYPCGAFSEEAEILLKKAGYKGACTTNRGFDILNKLGLYELDRVSVRDSNPYFSFSNLYKPMRFRSKLSGFYNLYRKRKEGE